MEYRLSRRQFLLMLGVGTIAIPLASKGILDNKHPPEMLFLSAKTDSAGRHYVCGIDHHGKQHFQLPTDWRGHSVIANPIRSHSAVIFARRPGNEAFEINLNQGTLAKRFYSSSDRHFYGHGCFSPNGKLLFTTENDFDHGRGVIVVRSTDDYRVLEEFPSFGVGPHDIQMLSDSKTLVIANGGIQTHPKDPRKKLNVPTMDSSLVYIDVSTGQLIDKYRLDNSKLSIRHLDVRSDDCVVTVMQYQGHKADNVPLIALHRGEETLKTLMANPPIQRAMNHYAASVCIDSNSGIAGMTCPRGNLVTFWDTNRGEFVSAQRIRDAGGIALSGDNHFVVTTGYGEIHRISPTKLVPDDPPIVISDTHFDNHLSYTMTL